MAGPPEITNMALFCDFENLALGVRDAKYAQFDMQKVLERLLLKGSIIVKKAYCDWERYKAFKASMHEAAFELIEIPHVRQSGKNSADIRLVVDALDLCYTKAHIDTFVILSGDSDFSPLVSKLRENNKGVIGVGVKKSTSDLLIANCDDFLFYDDVVREQEQKKQRAAKHAPGTTAGGAPKKTVKKTEPDKRQEAVDLIMETMEALIAERGAEDKIWGSMVKQTLKRRQPGFNESSYGFRSFSALLAEAERRQLLALERDEKSGGSILRMLVVYLSAADNCLAPKTGYNAPLPSHCEGAFCHDSTSILLSARVLGSPVAVCHAVPRLARPRRDDPAKASQAHHAAPPALHRPHTVCGPDAQAPLCPVCARSGTSQSAPSRT